MTTSAEHLLQLARDDYRMENVTAEQLTHMLIDCIVALSFRTGKTPANVTEDIWKSVIPDSKWNELMRLDRLIHELPDIIDRMAEAVDVNDD